MTTALTGRPTARAAEAILSFWFDLSKPYQWYRRNPAFDQLITTRFGVLHQAATLGKLDVWRAHPRHALALIILLDQFSRNMYRDSPRAFAQDVQALTVAREAIARRFDRLYPAKRRAFFYMPFMHCEELPVQQESVVIFEQRCPSNLSHARQHRDIVKRFGRFPHRNKVFNRASSDAEIAFLKAGGFNP